MGTKRRTLFTGIPPNIVNEVVQMGIPEASRHYGIRPAGIRKMVIVSLDCLRREAFAHPQVKGRINKFRELAKGLR